MEELQSTEALDREILEDARKKAFKILKNTDESISASKVSWQRKLERTLEKSKKSYAKKAEEAVLEITARYPMDEQRIRLETIDRFLNNAMEEFLGSLDRTVLLRVIEHELTCRSGEIAGKGGELRYRGLSREECSALVQKVVPGQSFRYLEDPLYAIKGSFPALIIDYPDVRITVSVDRAAENLLMDKRAELAAALLGNITDLAPSPAVPDVPGGGNG